MELHHSFKWIENGILLSTWDGPITRDEYREATLERVDLTQDANAPYVLIVDMRTANNKIMDMQLNKWAITVDPKMHSAIIITKGKMADVTLGMLAKMISHNMTYVTTMEEALEVAHQNLTEIEYV